MSNRLLFITPHLSTGGLPQYLLRQIESLKYDNHIYVIEYNNYSNEYIVQKDKIKNIILPNCFFTLDSDKTKILEIISRINPDIIYFEEIPEHFMQYDIARQIYDRKDRNYFIIETSHDSTFDIKYKKFLPDKFIHVSQYMEDKYKQFNIPSEIIEYPIIMKPKIDRTKALDKLNLNPNYKHVLNVGLFTPGKNQSRIIEIAKYLEDEKINFHFVGNQAENFKFYWEPLMKKLPLNCKIWGERNDVKNFYAAMDLFLFPSTFELNPIVIKEAISYHMPILMNNLEVYNNEYSKYNNVHYLSNDIKDLDKIKYLLGLFKNEVINEK